MKWGKRQPQSPDAEENSVDWPEYLVSLNTSTFQDFIQTHPYSIIDFWAPWCAPCRAMHPRIRRVTKLYVGKIAFGRLNTQQFPDIAKKYHIMSIPTILCFRRGKKVSEATGVKSIGALKTIAEDLLKT
jgi:thioredoxin 1